MQNLSDDELDNLFRKAAEELKPAYEPAHWKDLDAKLTSEKHSSNDKGWMWGGVIALLLIGTTVTIWSLREANSPDELATISPIENSVTKKNETLSNDRSTVAAKRSDEKDSRDTSTDVSTPQPRIADDKPNAIAHSTPVENSRILEKARPNAAPSDKNSIVATKGETQTSFHIEKKGETKTSGVIMPVQSGVQTKSNPGKKSTLSSSDKNSTDKNSISKNSIVATKEETQTSLHIEKKGEVKTSGETMPVQPGSQTKSNPGKESNVSPGTNETLSATSGSGAETKSTAEHEVSQEEPVATSTIQSDFQSPSTVTSEANTMSTESPLRKSSDDLPAEGGEKKTDDTALTKDDINKSVTVDDQEALRGQSTEGNGRGTSLAAASDLSVDSIQADQPEKDVSTAVSDKEVKERDATENSPRLSLKVALSPDYSSVRYSSFTKAGTNYGVLVEYRMAPRWSLATGVLSSRKIYTASDLEYNGHKADRTDGDCRIIDIPVNVFYHFKTQRSISFYASVGISSYIMNSEKYEFHVKSYGGGYSYTHKVEGENNELFSVINLSAGVNKQLTPRWGIQLEPFVKQSIKGIGDGDLSLSSLGAFLNLRYSIIK